MATQPRTPTASRSAAIRSAQPPRRRDTEPKLAYGDLRQWLDEARRLGEVKDVSGL